MLLKVIDKETKKVVWTEEHKTHKAIEVAVKQLKESNFNPKYFEFVKEDE